MKTLFTQLAAGALPYTGLKRCGAIIATLLAVTPVVARAQPANDNSCNAVVLPNQGGLCTVPVVGTTAGATPSFIAGFPNPSCGFPATGLGLPDVWYQFTTGASGPSSFGATLTVTGNPAGQLRLYSGSSCATGFNPALQQVACSAAATANTAAPRLITGALQPSTTYYVAVSGYATTDTPGPFAICLTDGPSTRACGTPVLSLPVNSGFPSITPTTATLFYSEAGNNTPPLALLVTGPGGFTQARQVFSSPVQLTGLTPGTTYQVQLTASCAALGQTSAPATLRLTTPRAYCTANVGGSCGPATITQVYMPGTQLDNRVQVPEGLNLEGFGCYTSHPPQGNLTTTLVAGQTYQLNTLVRTSASIAAWIDFDQNNQFDAYENIVPAMPAGGTVPAVGAFTVPANALLGTVGLRVRSASAGTTPGVRPGGACDVLANNGVGETEDYILTIAVATGTTAAALAAQVGLFPNPAHHAATLRVPGPLCRQPVEVVLYNPLGQEVLRRHLPAAPQTGHEVQLNVQRLPAALYMVRLGTGMGELSKRLVVE